MRRPRVEDGKIVVDVWLHYYLSPDFLDPVRRVAEEFNAAHPEYRVTVEGRYFQSLPREVSRAALEGRHPAVAEYLYLATREALDAVDANGAPLFCSVEEAVGGRQEILGEPVVLDQILPAMRDYFSYGGQLRCMPWMASTPLLFANTTLLDAAGVSELPRTWQELEAACEALAALDGGPPHGVTWANYGWFFQLAVAQQGGLLADRDNGRSGPPLRVDLTSEEMLAYVEWWRRLHRNGHYLYSGLQADSGGAPEAFARSFDAFAQQQVAFTIDSSVTAAALVEAGEKNGFAVRSAPVPHNGDRPHAGNLIGGDSLWLAAGLDEATRDGALAFMQYLNNPKNAADRHRASGFSPITTESVALLDEEGWFDRNASLRVAVDLLSAPSDSPASRGALVGRFAEIHDLLTGAMHDVLAAGASPRTRFARATADAQALVGSYGACLPGRSA